MNSSKPIIFSLLLVLGLSFPDVFVFAKETGDIVAVQKKIQTLKEIKKNDSPTNKVVKLKKDILYDIFDLMIEEDEKMGKRLLEARVPTSTQARFLEALWNDEQWYLERRLDTNKATSSQALAHITKEIKQYRQETQDLLHKQISGVILVGEARHGYNITKKRLDEITQDISQKFPEDKKAIADSYILKIEGYLGEIETSISIASGIFEEEMVLEKYEEGIEAITKASKLIQAIYEEFLAMGKISSTSTTNNI